jgi:hypothetical protein
MVNKVTQKLIFDFTRYTQVNISDGSIPLDTLAWFDACLGYAFGFIDMDKMSEHYDEILQLASDSFPKYNFGLHIDDEDCRGPNKVWLKYELLPEHQD